MGYHAGRVVFYANHFVWQEGLGTCEQFRWVWLQILVPWDWSAWKAFDQVLNIRWLLFRLHDFLQILFDFPFYFLLAFNFRLNLALIMLNGLRKFLLWSKELLFRSSVLLLCRIWVLNVGLLSETFDELLLDDFLKVLFLLQALLFEGLPYLLLFVNHIIVCCGGVRCQSQWLQILPFLLLALLITTDASSKARRLHFAFFLLIMLLQGLHGNPLI